MLQSPSVAAYDSLAPAYDVLTSHHRHDVWLDRILAIVDRLGVLGRRALDLGCGTGKSFVPLLERGWDVSACDASPRMVDLARRRHPCGAGRVVVADVRDGPPLGRFDLITALDDVFNCVLEDDELAAAFATVAGSLADDGVCVFDLNTLQTYREAFAHDRVLEREGRLLCWRGHADDPSPGDRVAATVEVIAPGTAGWTRTTSRHVQRHHTPASVRAALRAAGLTVLAVLGQRTGVELRARPDERTDTKALYVVRRAAAHRTGDGKEGEHGDHHAVVQAVVAGMDAVDDHRTGASARPRDGLAHAMPLHGGGLW